MANTAQLTPANAGKGVNDSRLHEFFIDEIKDIYWAELHIVKALPKMIESASCSELKQGFTNHLKETKGQVTRLEKVFSLLGEEADAKKCEAMNGILKEADDIVGETEDDTATRDVGLILAAQKVEHYEISTYGGLTQLAKTLGRDDIAELLHATLEEEKATDEKLTSIAESHVNYDAAAEPVE